MAKSVYYFINTTNNKAYRVEEESEVTVGRSIDNHIIIDDISVSRNHSVIRWKKGQMFLFDNGSTNGTQVNGKKCNSDYGYVVQWNDEVQFGDVKFRIVDEDTVIMKRFDEQSKRMGATVIIKKEDEEGNEKTKT